MGTLQLTQSIEMFLFQLKMIGSVSGLKQRSKRIEITHSKQEGFQDFGCLVCMQSMQIKDSLGPLLGAQFIGPPDVRSGDTQAHPQSASDNLASARSITWIIGPTRISRTHGLFCQLRAFLHKLTGSIRHLSAHLGVQFVPFPTEPFGGGTISPPPRISSTGQTSVPCRSQL
jgi:hypothetical protein